MWWLEFSAWGLGIVILVLAVTIVNEDDWDGKA